MVTGRAPPPSFPLAATLAVVVPLLLLLVLLPSLPSSAPCVDLMLTGGGCGGRPWHPHWVLGVDVRPGTSSLPAPTAGPALPYSDLHGKVSA